MDYEPLKDVDLEKERLDPTLPDNEIPRTSTKWNSFGDLISLRTTIEASCAITTTILLLVLYVRLPQRIDVGGNLLLQIPNTSWKFNSERYFADGRMFSNSTLLEEVLPRFWELSSDGRGFVQIPESHHAAVGSPQKFYIEGHGTRKSHTIAYFHQIHCIAKITALYGNARLGTGHPEEDDEHMAHCIDVLRQAIMCFADTTLENGDDGWEVMHQCRDYKKVQEWAEERAVWNWTEVIGAGHRIDIP